MKVIALAILFILLIFTIKSTPSSLNKQLWKLKIQEGIEKQKKSNLDEDTLKTAQGFSIILVFLFEIFMITFYAILGTKLGGTYIMVLSALQIFTCLYFLFTTFDKSLFSLNIEDYKFRRWFLLFNKVIDYIYYPVAIYMLLK